MNLFKPWYVWNPSQVFIRALRSCTPRPHGYRPLRLACDVPIMADPDTLIGGSIWRTGVHDIAVSEVLARLIDPGDFVVDGGAHVGGMTVLAALAAGEQGEVLAFEPHPELFAVLERSADIARRSARLARLTLRNVALGANAGRAVLVEPPGFTSNDGVALIGPRGLQGRTYQVSIQSLDEAIGTRYVAVLKLDLEGYEAEALRGAAAAMAAGRIRHVIFEQLEHQNGRAAEELSKAGYVLYSIGWSLNGPRLAAADGPRIAGRYEAPSCLATLAPDEAMMKCRARGWIVLRRHLGRTFRNVA